MKNMTLLRSVCALIAIQGVTAFGQLANTNTTAPGNGTLRVGGKNYDLNKATVIFNDNKSAEIVVYGQENLRMKGRWAKGDNNWTAEVTITEGGWTTRGRGIVTFDSRYRLSKIDISGTSSRGNINVQFLTGYGTSGGSGGSGGWGGSGGSSSSYWAGRLIGEGTLWTDGNTDKIRDVAIDLAKGGKMVVTTVADGKKVQYEGEWFDRRGDKVDFRIDRGPNKGTEARGEIFFKGNSLFRITFDGRDSRGPLEMRFQADDQVSTGGTKPDGSSSVDISTSGRGTIVRGEGRGSLDSARVEFSKNGSAKITLDGQKKYTFQGTWKKVSDYYEVTIVRGFDNLLTRGTARIRVRSNNEISIEISGKDGDGKRYSVSYSSR